ncbi:hypothetical protein EG327_007368 [Venturia inaequalis]|uniref:FAD-binding PCMH-type domain-containing protein n=1 Tax=Venturia inaequalis TaxID=5025 RepID=A0A8H3ZI84_VENIN|nr:hypothetical protein EG327_007368 [Venturia inaequalis]
MKSFILSLLLSLAASQASPAGPRECKILATDSSWPAQSVWRQAMPEVEEVAVKGERKRPDMRLDATSVDEVTAAVKFAANNNIRLSILNSGHDFHGRNDAPNGLALVTTGLKGVRVLSKFTPTAEGAKSVNLTTKANVIPPQSDQAYVTFGAGLSTQQLNNEIAKSNLFTLGAAHSEVSVAGGWGQTAGHAPLSPKYGLGADQPVEYKVVTADGKLRIANAVSNPDLFWALRGGGGGTYGVVVEATIKAYPSPKVSTSSFFINATDHNDKKSMYKAAAYIHSQFPEWSDKGLSSYYYLYPDGMYLFSMNSGDKEGVKEWHDTNWKPVMEKMGDMPGMNKSTIVYTSRSFPNFKTFYDAVFGMIDGPMPGMDMKKPGRRAVRNAKEFARVRSFFKRHGPGEAHTATQSKGIAPMDSWLLGAEHLKSDKFAQVLEDAMPKMEDGQMRGQLIGGGKVTSLGNDTSVVPAWRRTYSHIVLTGYGQTDAGPFRAHAPDMGAYVNEASYLTPGYKEAFWGSHYERLSEIKKQYDPQHLFWVTPSINAEVWAVQPDGRLCRSTPNPLSQVSKANEIAPKNDNANFVNQKTEDETRGAAFPWQWTPQGNVLVRPKVLAPPPPPVSGEVTSEKRFRHLGQ